VYIGGVISCGMFMKRSVRMRPICAVELVSRSCDSCGRVEDFLVRYCVRSRITFLSCHHISILSRQGYCTMLCYAMLCYDMV
jgi:hypothetical protein